MSEIKEIVVVVLSGDEVIEVRFKDGSREFYDASDNRKYLDFVTEHIPFRKKTLSVGCRQLIK